MKTQLNQTRLGKWDSSVAVVRLIRELQERLTQDELTSKDNIDIDNIVNQFLSQVPRCVKNEVAHG
jgi:hypothetical protein